MSNISQASVIVQDTGFLAEDWAAGFTAPEAANRNEGTGIDLGPDTDPATLGRYLSVPAIRIRFPSFADGRGFTLARRLRLMGYKGRLRAHGHVIADQYGMARRAGFDEVEIGAELAARQPQEQWLARASWSRHDYQSRLRS